jgi:mutual gliding-motility protein MglA
MAYLNVKERVIEAKIVYYGAGLSGKTTNLEQVKKLSAGGNCGEMMSLNTDGDRTLYFDWLPYNIGKVSGCEVKIQLYTVPGQPQYAETRRKVLSGADGVVLVLDSQSGALEKNLSTLKDLRAHIAANKLEHVPWVVQLNKRDLPTAMAPEDLLKMVGLSGSAYVEAVAAEGRGVFETLQEATKAVLESVRSSAKAKNGQIAVGSSSGLDGGSLYKDIVRSEAADAPPSDPKLEKAKPTATSAALEASPRAAQATQEAPAVAPKTATTAPKSTALAPSVSNPARDVVPASPSATATAELAAMHRAIVKRIDAMEQGVQLSFGTNMAELERRVLSRVNASLEADQRERRLFMSQLEQASGRVLEACQKLTDSVASFDKSFKKLPADLQGQLATEGRDIKETLKLVTSQTERLGTTMHIDIGRLQETVQARFKTLETADLERGKSLDAALAEGFRFVREQSYGVEERFSVLEKKVDEFVDEAQRAKKRWFG